jgi:hypothetical protein
MRVHGISFNVDWKTFRVGTSFFIPCLDAAEAKKQVLRVTKRLGFAVRTRTVVEENIQGLRVWRIK